MNLLNSPVLPALYGLAAAGLPAAGHCHCGATASPLKLVSKKS